MTRRVDRDTFEILDRQTLADLIKPQARLMRIFRDAASRK
jgi:hypothetical protein